VSRKLTVEYGCAATQRADSRLQECSDLLVTNRLFVLMVNQSASPTENSRMPEESRVMSLALGCPPPISATNSSNRFCGMGEMPTPGLIYDRNADSLAALKAHNHLNILT